MGRKDNAAWSQSHRYLRLDKNNVAVSSCHFALSCCGLGSNLSRLIFIGNSLCGVNPGLNTDKHQ